MTHRRLARECALEVLYRLDLVGDEPARTIEELLHRKNPSDDAENDPIIHATSGPLRTRAVYRAPPPSGVANRVH